MDNYASCLLLLVSVNLLGYSSHVIGSGMSRIRGIPVSKSTLYRPDRDFECLDGSLLIPFTSVNDDYCDCADGSDEPGTAACTNGVFYCENSGYKPVYIPSAWVNDGVCDCCDTSDEYASKTHRCVNNCNELGREAKLERQKAEQLAREGNRLRIELVTKGKAVKVQHQSRLVKLRADYEEAVLIKKEKEIRKTQAEERESLALEKYKPAETEQSQTGITDGEEEQLTANEAENYFKILDSDSSGTITIAELQTRATFDKNRDGAVSDDEALYFLNNNEEVTLQEFVDSAWANIKPFLMLEQGMFKPTTDKQEADVQETFDDSVDDGKLESDEDIVDEEANDDETTDEGEAPAEEQEKEPEIQYDEETQALIDEANSARGRFQEAEKAVNEMQSEMKQLEEKLDRDYGPEEVFAAMDGECFEYTDIEYVYNLCLFGKTTQRSKSGGSDINLGYWHEWVGPSGNKYSKMKYDRGLTCWNGPARSTIITLSCGKENMLISVTEPSRCEYAMEFLTPAMCNPSVETGDRHDEL